MTLRGWYWNCLAACNAGRTNSGWQSPCAFGFSRDNISVYYEDKKIPGSDPETFEILGENGYSKDKNNVYFENHIIDGADIKTFRALAGKIAEDKNNYYKSEKISGKK